MDNKVVFEDDERDIITAIMLHDGSTNAQLFSYQQALRQRFKSRPTLNGENEINKSSKNKEDNKKTDNEEFGTVASAINPTAPTTNPTKKNDTEKRIRSNSVWNVYLF